MAFPKKGKDNDTDIWRNTVIVCVGWSDDSFYFNPDKHHIYVQTNCLKVAFDR